MHIAETIELAALLATHGEVVIRLTRRFPPEAVQSYWTHSKCRLENWGKALREYDRRLSTGDYGWSRDNWAAIRAQLEEVLMAEVLTRVASALIMTCDGPRSRQEDEPLVRGVFVAHLEVRRRVLNYLLEGRFLHTAEAVAMNRLRRRCERWTDMLLGYLGEDCQIAPWSFNESRAREFAVDAVTSLEEPRRETAWRLMLASLRLSFRAGVCPASPNAHLNQAIAAAVLECLGSDVFTTTGQVKSLWMARLGATTEETEGLLEDLLRLDEPVAWGPAADRSTGPADMNHRWTG